MRRRLAHLFAAGCGVALVVACGSTPAPKEPRLTLRYTPIPPVAGEPLTVKLEGSDVGVVDLYQGGELLGRLVNPLSRDVPAGFFVFTAKNGQAPTAVVFDTDGRRIEFGASSAGGVVPGPVDASAIDTGTPTPPPTTTQEPPPPIQYVKTCPFLQPAPDAGYQCDTPSSTVTGIFKNPTGNAMRVDYSDFVGVCSTRSFEIPANDARSWTFNSNQTIEITDKTTLAKLRVYRIPNGASGNCNVEID